MIINGCDRSLDAEWLRSIKNFLGDRAINPHTPKRDASALDPVAESAANVALGRPALGTVGDLQFSTAAGASKKTRKQSLAPANRAAPQVTSSIGVIGNQALIPLKFLPRNILLVVALDQNVPVLPIAAYAATGPLTSVLDRHRCTPPAEGVGSAIDWVCQDVMYRVVHGRLPVDLSLAQLVNHDRQQ